MNVRAVATRWYIVAAVVLSAAFVLMGIDVSHVAPRPHDEVAYRAFFGQATALAAAITRAGTFPFYAGLCVIAIIAALVRREWLGRVALAIATLVIAWQVSDVFKELFHRPRPPHWLVFHETSYSYPSGHAVLVTAFWGVWAMYLASGPRSSARVAGIIAIVAWILAIGWSRLALGAHYLSDVIGGYLLGLAFVNLAAVVARLLQPATREAAPLAAAAGKE